MEQAPLPIPQDFEWFWQSDPDPFAESDPTKWTWTIYSPQVCLAIEEAFQRNLPIADIGNYEIDFKKMFQVHKSDRYRMRRVKREVKKVQMSQSRFFFPIPKPSVVPQKAQKTMNDAFGNVQHFLNFIMKRTPEAKALYQRLVSLTLDSQKEEYVDIIESVKNCLIKGAEARADELMIKRMPDKAKAVLKESEEIIREILDQTGTLKDFLTVILKVYTMESFVCYWLNELLRNEVWEGINVLTPYLVCLVYTFMLNNYVIKLEEPGTFTFFLKKKMLLYRGATLSMEHFACYDPAKTKLFSWNSVISTSRSQKVAMNFINLALKKAKDLNEDKIGVIFIIEKKIGTERDCQGMIDISRDSRYPNELEVIVAPGTVFRVLKTQEINSHLHEVYLKIKKSFAKEQKGVLGTLLKIKGNTGVIDRLQKEDIIKILALMEGNQLISKLEIRNCVISPHILEVIESTRKTTKIKREDVIWKDNVFKLTNPNQINKYFQKVNDFWTFCCENEFSMNGTILQRGSPTFSKRVEFHQGKEFSFYIEKDHTGIFTEFDL